MVEEKYKYLYEPQYRVCGRCNGKGKLYIPGLERLDRHNHYGATDNLGGDWYVCAACEGQGKVFDPIETWGQDKPKEKQQPK